MMFMKISIGLRQRSASAIVRSLVQLEEKIEISVESSITEIQPNSLASSTIGVMV